VFSLFLFVIVYMTFSQYSKDYFYLSSGIRKVFREQFKVTKETEILNI
jgi:hypothetical protein